MLYQWYFRKIMDLGNFICKGIVEANNLSEAKRKVTVAANIGRWKKRWREEVDKNGKVYFKTNGDGRTHYMDKLGTADYIVFFREMNDKTK